MMSWIIRFLWAPDFSPMYTKEGLALKTGCSLKVLWMLDADLKLRLSRPVLPGGPLAMQGSA